MSERPLIAMADASAEIEFGHRPARTRRWMLAIIGLLGMSTAATLWVNSEPRSALGAGPTTAPAASAATQPAATEPASTPGSVPAIPTFTYDSQTFTSIRGAEGFWRVGRTAQNVFWFVSPANHVEFMNMVTTVQPFQLGRRAGGPQFVSSDWNGGSDTASGDLNAWASATLNRVREAGFKGLGAWCHPVFHNLDVPISRDLNLWAHAQGADALLYSPRWHEIIEAAVQRQVTPLVTNRNVVGYYTDNELDWSDTGAGPGVYFNNLPSDNPNKKKVVDVIQSLWPTLDAFNAAWNSQLKSWDELAALPTLPREPADAYAKLLSAWVAQLAHDYFQTTTDLIHKYDPNHLILGVRFKGVAPSEVVRGARGETDAISINYYPSDGKIDPDMFPMVTREADQPIIITEYSFHALDGRSGNRNTFGFSAQVMDQQARADGYKLFTTRLARTPYIIGADWFQWMDEPPSGRTPDGEDVNFGVVDIDDRPYEQLTSAIRETTAVVNGLHATSATDLGLDIARERFNEHVKAVIPYLEKPIRINGELSDWPKETKLLGMRHAPTLGLDRSDLPLPNIYMAWNEKGLYVGCEVFDHDIEGAPADGWWWTRDEVELFLSTKTPEANQSFYTPHDHQFFFVPIAFPGTDGNTGVVGRWHRPGDAVAGNVIPATGIQQASRMLSDRYVIEMFIPGSELHDWDPTGKTPMAMNINVRNFQNALEYFWSAPKQVQTHLRPGTWGEMDLAPRNAPDFASSIGN